MAAKKYYSKFVAVFLVLVLSLILFSGYAYAGGRNGDSCRSGGDCNSGLCGLDGGCLGDQPGGGGGGGGGGYAVPCGDGVCIPGSENCGSCPQDCCPTPCGNENEPDTNGCCAGLGSISGLCCNWGEEVDCGVCHVPCPDNQIYDCDRRRCRDPIPPCQGECCNVNPNSWVSLGSSCGRCGTVQRWCDIQQQYTNSYRCVNEGPCTPGQEDNNGGSCGAGNCGVLERDCQSNCRWSSWYCNGGNPSYGQPCGSCGRGTKDCNNNCIGDHSNCGSAGWKNVGGCGKCGTYQRYCNGCDWTSSYQCVNQGPCSPGQVTYGGSCGTCGTSRQDCQSNCQWGGSYCYGERTPQACGSCGRGRTNCAGGCDGDYSNCGSAGWKNTGTCGNCGTRQTYCNGCDYTSQTQCANQGVCSPGSTRACGNGGTQTCTSSCGWGSCQGEGCIPGQTKGCGNCGTQTCQSNYQWNSCANQGPCSPGQTRGCGNCGTESCSSSCQWGSSCAGQGPCSPGQTQTQGCGNGGTQSRTCTSSCGWPSSWSACAGEGCTPGATQSCGDCGTQTCQSNNQWGSCAGNGQTQTQACGNCGSQSKACQSNGVYSALSVCAGQGVCTAGQTDSQACGNCGTQTKTCSSSCQWSGYGTCAGSGPCSPGQTDSLGCTACKTKTCQNNCNWGPCSSSGSCTTGQTQCVNNRYQTCPICSWAGTGTNADSDARDKECGDSLCDSSPGVYDATKVASETLATCKDTLDNDCDGATDCADSDCNGVAGCCTVIKRDCKQLTEQQFKEMYSRCYKERDSAYCSKITNQISGGINFYSCQKNDADTSCCPNPSSCVFNGVCYPDGAKVDINGDGIINRCVAHSPGQWIPDFETDCTNGIDDDLDGFIDCADTDCDGNLNGKTVNQNGQLISFVDITAKKDLVPIKSVQTAQDGTYTMNIGCGDYNIMSAHSIYAPQTKVAFVPPRGDLSINFTLVKGTSCEFDCTYASDNLVHASCDGKSGCGFYDPTAKAACDLSQPGWIREYNSSNYVVCPSGNPQPKVEILASLSCTSGTIIKVTKIVVYNGKPVKLVVAACK